MRQVPTQPVFTGTEAARLGWTQSALRHAVVTRRLIRVRRDLYTAAPAITLELAAIAATRSCSYCVISHRSAALVHGLPLVGPKPALPEITVPPRRNANVPGVHLHRARLGDVDVVDVGGTPVTSVARTVIDVARSQPLRTAVVVADAALHRRLVTLAQLDSMIRDCWNWPGIRRAQRAVGLVDGRSESPLESISRLVIPLLGLPAPEPQQWIYDEHGFFVARADFYWDEFGVVGEADGRGKYADLSVVWDEKERQDALADTGLEVARWGWAQADRYPQQLEARVRAAFERGRRRDRSGLPRLWTLGASLNVAW